MFCSLTCIQNNKLHVKLTFIFLQCGGVGVWGVCVGGGCGGCSVEILSNKGRAIIKIDANIFYM